MEADSICGLLFLSGVAVPLIAYRGHDSVCVIFLCAVSFLHEGLCHGRCWYLYTETEEVCD